MKAMMWVCLALCVIFAGVSAIPTPPKHVEFVSPQPMPGVHSLVASTPVPVAETVEGFYPMNTILECTAEAQGHPASYHWHVTYPDLGYQKDVCVGEECSVILSTSGTWKIELEVKYLHEIQPGELYVTSISEEFKVPFFMDGFESGDINGWNNQSKVVIPPYKKRQLKFLV